MNDWLRELMNQSEHTDLDMESCGSEIPPTRCNHPERLKRAWVRAVHAVLRMSLPVTVMPTTARTPAHVAKSAGRGGSWPRPLPLLSLISCQETLWFPYKIQHFPVSDSQLWPWAKNSACSRTCTHWGIRKWSQCSSPLCEHVTHTGPAPGSPAPRWLPLSEVLWLTGSYHSLLTSHCSYHPRPVGVLKWTHSRAGWRKQQNFLK